MKETPITFNKAFLPGVLAGTKTRTARLIKFPPHAYQPDASWIQSVYQDGGGNWVAWSCDTPDLAEFTKKAYPHGEGFPCRYGRPGDLLWVKETLVKEYGWLGRYTAKYQVDETPAIKHVGDYSYEGNWDWEEKTLSSRFMPKWACRCWLELIAVEARSLLTITEEEARQEGMLPNWVSDFGDLDKFEINPPGWDPDKHGYLPLNWKRFKESEGPHYWTARDAFLETFYYLNHLDCSDDLNPWTWMLTFRKVDHVPHS